MSNHKRSQYSLNDIAQALGVSKATVSRALSGSKGVGKSLREKIVRFADEVDYRPNSLAQGLARGHTNIVALILDDIRNPFYAELAFKLQHLLAQDGYMLMILNSEYNSDKELSYINMVSQFNFAGLFLLTVHSKKVEDALSGMNIPVVLINRALPSYKGDYVLLDNFQAGYIAAIHLIESNHQRIGFISGPHFSPASYQRYMGYCQAMSNFQVQDVKEYFWQSDLTMESGYLLASQYLQNPVQTPTAMIVSNDITAIGFMSGLKEHGVRIPDDLSIVSFDNISFSSAAGIDLTSVDQNINEICRESARLMLKQLRTPDAAAEKIIITPTLVVRKTTMPVPSGGA